MTHPGPWSLHEEKRQGVQRVALTQLPGLPFMSTSQAWAWNCGMGALQ